MSDLEVEAMAEGKKSFILYIDSYNMIEMLAMEQKGALLDAIYSLHGCCECPELDQATAIVFAGMKRYLLENMEKWEETRHKRAEAGAKGGKAKAENSSKDKQNLANASKCYNELANSSKDKQNLAVNVNVNDNVNVNVNDKEKRKKEKVATASSDCGAECSTAVEPLSQKSKKEANAHFEKLWALYPHKRGKNQVSDKTKRKLLDVSVQEMAEAINRYVQEVRVNDKPWLNGSTWFNGRYLDYTAGNYSPVVASGKKVRYMSEEGFRDFSGLEE